MIYTLIMNKRSYDLPKKTLAIVEQMDEIIELDQNSALSTRQKYQEILNFVSGLIGEDSVKQIFGAADIDQIDLSELLISFRKIVDAYNKPVQDYERGQGIEQFNQLPLDQLTQLAGLLNQVTQQPHD